MLFSMQFHIESEMANLGLSSPGMKHSRHNYGVPLGTRSARHIVPPFSPFFGLTEQANLNLN